MSLAQRVLLAKSLTPCLSFLINEEIGLEALGPFWLCGFITLELIHVQVTT